MEIYEQTNSWIAAKLGEHFRSYRQALRMTQKEMSAQSGVSVMTIVRFERGEYGSIKLDNLIALLRAIERLEYLPDLIPEMPASLYSPQYDSQVQRVRRKKNER